MPVVIVSPQSTICLGCKVTKALLGRGLVPSGRCHLCQAPEMGHRPLPGGFLPCFLFPVSRCCQGRRTWRNTSTLCRPATGLVGWEISHTWDGPTSQSHQGQGNQQSQHPPPHSAAWQLVLPSTGLPASGRSITFLVFPKYHKL